MKTVVCQAPQGDVCFTKVAAVPAGYAPALRTAHGLVVAHSETGHHHVVSQPGATLYESASQPGTAFLELLERATIRHLRGYDTHEEFALPPGVWEVSRQREYDPFEGERRAAD